MLMIINKVMVEMKYFIFDVLKRIIYFILPYVFIGQEVLRTSACFYLKFLSMAYLSMIMYVCFQIMAICKIT